MEKVDKTEYFPYVDGLKIIACIMIVCYHYLAVYRDAITFTPTIPWLDTICFSRLGFLTDSGQGFWNYLFFIASGFLLSGKSIDSVSCLIRTCLMRFVRFALPLLFSCFVIWLMSFFLGFHNPETSSLFDNPWFQTAYKQSVTVWDVIRSPVDVLLFGRNVLNAPYWVISGMFFASLLIYGLQFLTHTFSPLCRLIVLIAVALLFFPIREVISACLFGAVTRQLAILLPANWKSTLLSVTLSLMSIMVYMYVTVSRPKIAVFCFICFFIGFFLLVDKTLLVRKLFSTRSLLRLSGLSWEIYSFHWPILCSIGSLFLITFTPSIGLLSAYGSACLVCVCFTLVLSMLYHLSFGKLSSFLNRKISAFFLNFIPGA